jgi:hypothetical protein
MSYFAYKATVIDEGFEICENVVISPEVIQKKIVRFKIMYRFTRESFAKIILFQKILKKNILGILAGFTYLTIFKTIDLT